MQMIQTIGQQSNWSTLGKYQWFEVRQLQLPALQLLQTAAATPENWPAEQLVQTADWASEKVPALQLEHEMDPEKENGQG